MILPFIGIACFIGLMALVLIIATRPIEKLTSRRDRLRDPYWKPDQPPSIRRLKRKYK